MRARSDAGRGRLAAASAVGTTILSQNMRDVLATFKRLDDDGKATFANHYLAHAAAAMDDTWPVVYQMLHLVEERRLYADPVYMKGETFATFAEYFEARIGKPFSTWADLEATHHYVQRFRPELVNASFQEARAARLGEVKVRRVAGESVRAIAEALGVSRGTVGNALIQLSSDGQLDEVKTIRGRDGRDRRLPDSRSPISQAVDLRKQGMSLRQIGQRLGVSHTEVRRLLERVAAGNVPPVSKAVKPRVAVTTPARIAASLRKHLSQAQLVELARLLMEGN